MRVLETFREANYNATVEEIHFAHDELMILRVVTDGGKPPFAAGQYLTLGLGDCEPRVDGIPSVWNVDAPRLIRRAYSVSCPMLDENNRLLHCDECPFIEFYIVLVQRPIDNPPPLTPRLFALKRGDRLAVGMKPHGHYSIDAVRNGDNVLFAATGTGEAPHNAMIAELLARKHQGRITAVTCVRRKYDLAYLAAHRQLEQLFPQYRYIALTTREPENFDPEDPGYVGKRYLQDLFSSSDYVDTVGFELQPEDTRVFLCGSPSMIGLPTLDSTGTLVFPESLGMAEILTQKGMHLDEPSRPGNVHFEKYW